MTRGDKQEQNLCHRRLQGHRISPTETGCEHQREERPNLSGKNLRATTTGKEKSRATSLGSVCAWRAREQREGDAKNTRGHLCGVITLTDPGLLMAKGWEVFNEELAGIRAVT